MLGQSESDYPRWVPLDKSMAGPDLQSPIMEGLVIWQPNFSPIPREHPTHKET